MEQCRLVTITQFTKRLFSLEFVFYDFSKDLRVILANSRNVNLIQSSYQIQYCLPNNTGLNQSEKLINLNQILFWLMATSLSRIGVYLEVWNKNWAINELLTISRIILRSQWLHKFILLQLGCVFLFSANVCFQFTGVSILKIYCYFTLLIQYY